MSFIRIYQEIKKKKEKKAQESKHLRREKNNMHYKNIEKTSTHKEISDNKSYMHRTTQSKKKNMKMFVFMSVEPFETY